MKDTFEKAKQLIINGHTKHVMARTIDDKEIDPTDKKACKFCLVGAIYNSIGKPKDFMDMRSNFLHHVFPYIKNYDCISIAEFNDKFSTIDVINLLDQIINDFNKSTGTSVLKINV